MSKEKKKRKKKSKTKKNKNNNKDYVFSLWIFLDFLFVFDLLNFTKLDYRIGVNILTLLSPRNFT
jgi:hypothetical protein